MGHDFFPLLLLSDVGIRCCVSQGALIHLLVTPEHNNSSFYKMVFFLRAAVALACMVACVCPSLTQVGATSASHWSDFLTMTFKVCTSGYVYMLVRDRMCVAYRD
jgi:hypothetical protein